MVSHGKDVFMDGGNEMTQLISQLNAHGWNVSGQLRGRGRLLVTRPDLPNVEIQIDYSFMTTFRYTAWRYIRDGVEIGNNYAHGTLQEYLAW